MAVYRIYPEKDTFLFSTPTIAGLYGNAGRDEILEIGGYPDPSFPLTGRTSRTLIQFKQSEITSALTDKVSGNYSASINLALATAGEIPTSFTVYANPVSSSWTEGTGKQADNPVNRTGATWKYKDAATTQWTTLGGDYLAVSQSSQAFDKTSTYDINMDVTSATKAFASSSINNNGWLLRMESAYEGYTSASIHLKYFGSDTNTIFPPYLQFKWDDSSTAGSLTELTTDIATISIKNAKPEYTDSDKSRFRLAARPKYPPRTFVTASIYTTNYRLPATTYWGIRDEYSEEMIIDFDTNYTKVSYDSNGSFFDVYMDTLQPERYYRLLIKTTLNGSDLVIDNKNIFKVVRNG